MSKTVFTSKRDELCEILKRLNNGLEESCRIPNLQNLIKESQTCCIDENKREEVTKLMNAWKKYDADVIAELERQNQSVHKRFDSFEQNVKQDMKQIKVELTANALDTATVRETLSLILDAIKTVIAGQQQTYDNEVQTACNNLLSDMKDSGASIDRVEEGSILITFRSPTRLALENLRQYIADQMYREKLAVLENAVNKCIMCPVKLNISIVPEHTSSAVMQTDRDTSKKSVVLTFKCRGSEGVNAVGALANGSSTNKLKDLSDALSRSVGEKIKLNTTVTVDDDNDNIEHIDQPSTDGNIEIQEDLYKKNIFRYQYLLVEIGTAVMRKVFDFKVESDFVKHLSANNNTFFKKLQSLISMKIISADQAQHLPPIDNSPKSTNMDITLLVCLLRNVCGLRGQDDPVWKNPAPTDLSLEADLARLKECRNNLQHCGRVFISERDMTAKWNELSQILNRLNSECGILNLSSLIIDANSMDIDEELKDRHDQVIKSWTDMDNLCDSGVEEFKLGQSGMQEISTKQQVTKRPTEYIEQINLDCKRQKMDVGESGMQEISTKQQGTKRPIESIEQINLEWKHKKMDMNKTDLRNYLVQIYKEECCTLPVSPLCDVDENEVEILSIYQPPSLYHIPYHRTNEKEETYSISSYKEIFCKDDRTFRKIYMTGDAGVGKTSFCKRMAFIWCKSQCRESVSEKSVQNDIDFMAKFDFVFYVSLRDTHRKDVVAMIIEQSFCKENDLKKKEIYECVENILRNDECIIIMDALEEWTPAESGNMNINTLLSDKCSFVMTCRPYKIENERLSIRDFDRRIHITGIKKRSTKCYITEILNRINVANVDNKEPNDFISDVNKCGLQGQLRIPIITGHLVAVWFDHELTDLSRALIYSKVVDMLLKRAEKRKDIELPSSAESKLKFPDSVSELFYLKKHNSFLKKICLLSFNVLFKQDKCLSELVFTTEQLQSEPYCISANEMDCLCKFGILTRRKVVSRFGKREQKLSYLHNTYLEYFAALFVSSFDLDNVFDNIVQQWTTVNDVVQFENFFIFFVGLSIHESKFLFENMYHTISDDLSLSRKNAVFLYDKDSCSEQIKLLQTMVINCFKEVSGSNDPTITFKLEDFIFDDYSSACVDTGIEAYYVDDDDSRSGSGDSYDDDGVKVNYIANLSNDPNNSLETDHFVRGNANSVHNLNSNVDILKRLLLLNTTCVKSIQSVRGKYYDVFHQIKNLQCLCVGKVLSGDFVKFTEVMLQNLSTLHTVCIKGYGTLIPELPVRSLQHLTSLSLSDVKMQHYSFHNLVKFLSDNVLIENIKLCKVVCDNHGMIDRDCTLTLNLLNHTKLTSLYLQLGNISYIDLNNSSLKSITLFPSSERIVRCYMDVFNCIKYSQLEHLCINEWFCYMLDYSTIKTLPHTVKTLPYIKSLTLYWMKLPDDALLRLHPDVTQVKVKLWWVTMSSQCFHCFIESFVNKKSVIEVELGSCNIALVNGEIRRELSEEESVDYMSDYLTSIPTVNITDKDDYMLHFISRGCQ